MAMRRHAVEDSAVCLLRVCVVSLLVREREGDGLAREAVVHLAQNINLVSVELVLEEPAWSC